MFSKYSKRGLTMLWKRLFAAGCLTALALMTVSMQVTVGQGTAAAPTFYKDVVPVLQNNCQSCHRPGEIGPMSFLTYKDTRPWAKAIKTAVVGRKMPPWFSEPGYSHFANDRRLSDAAIKTLSAWADGGALEGDAKDAPPPIAFREGWSLKPDMIIEMPQDINLPA